MKIDRNTKISTIIGHNKAAIDVIASINPHFKKLRNPILRKVLAPRVTIVDAARIGKCTVDDFFDALQKIGFEIRNIEEKPPTDSSEHGKLIEDRIEKGMVETFDARPIIEGGTDPFNEIMNALTHLPSGYVLKLINSFEPVPLIKLLTKKGYISTVKEQDGLVLTHFMKTDEEERDLTEQVQIHKVSIEELEKEKEKYTGHCKEIDVRDLEMPIPMVTILNELENLDQGMALFVHHKKAPQYLLPELEVRGVDIWIAEISEGNVKLLIHE